MYIRINMRCRLCGKPGFPCKIYFPENYTLNQVSDLVIKNLDKSFGYHKCSAEEFGITEPISFEKMRDKNENNSRNCRTN